MPFILKVAMNLTSVQTCRSHPWKHWSLGFQHQTFWKRKLRGKSLLWPRCETQQEYYQMNWGPPSTSSQTTIGRHFWMSFVKRKKVTNSENTSKVIFKLVLLCHCIQKDSMAVNQSRLTASGILSGLICPISGWQTPPSGICPNFLQHWNIWI